MAFLNSLANPLQALMAGASPGFAGGMFGGGANPNGSMSLGAGLADIGGGMENAIAQNAAQPRQPHKPKMGIAEIVGAIADGVRGYRGQAPVYGPMMEERRKQEARSAAMSNFLADPQSAIQALMEGGDAELGLQLWKMTQGEGPPDSVREMQAFGIDPRSPEGQELFKRKFGGKDQSDPTFVRELEALGIDPHSPEAKELYFGRNSPAGYLLKPREGGQSGGLPRVNSPDEARSLPPGSKFLMPDGRVGTVPGGPTQPASGPFPR